MFEQVKMAPPDAILGLSEAFKKDTNPEKINLGVGVYKDSTGKTPIMQSVKNAEEKLLAAETTKSYLPIPGNSDYAAAVQQLVFGTDADIIKTQRAVTVQTPGGTGALRVAADLLKKTNPKAKLWVSDPTWANHTGIFTEAGFEVKTYRYYDSEKKSLDFQGMLSAIKTIDTGDIILLHGCCHNPTGVDPSLEQWAQIINAVNDAKLLPLLDFAYQGLAKGIEEDAQGLRLFTDSCKEMMVCSSFSKNFGLYNERTGGLTIVAGSKETAQKVFSQVKITIRRNYSNPPFHGAAIVATVMADKNLRSLWESEVAQIRDRITQMRQLFVKTLKGKNAKGDFSFIIEQNGMFSFSGLNPDQVKVLRDKYSIYIVGSGRINVAGLTADNMDRLCAAIAEIL